MNFKNILGQVFRESTGMPPKVRVYNGKLDTYKEIISCVSTIEDSTIKYFNESSYYEWKLIEADFLRLEYDLKHNTITTAQYVTLLKAIEDRKNIVLSDFIDLTDAYFVAAYRNRLGTIKERNSKDPYISAMAFNLWVEMKNSREIAELAVTQIETSDDYVDSKRIAEIRDRYLRDRHLRRGR